MSYWPPWHGQPNPEGGDVSEIRVTSLYCFAFVSSGAAACTGQPRCAQWFEMIVKLGCLPRKPLLRTNAVLRETSPCAGSAMNVVTTQLPSG